MNTCTRSYYYIFLLLYSMFARANASYCMNNTEQYKLNTALLYQTKLGNLSAVTELLNLGANPNATYNHNNSILGLALFYKQYTIAQLLLEQGADPNARNSFSCIILCTVIARDDKIAVRLLLNHKANPNTTDICGNTPLHAAVYRGHLEIIKMLLNHGADIYIKNRQGTTVLSLIRNKLTKPHVLQHIQDAILRSDPTAAFCIQPR